MEAAVRDLMAIALVLLGLSHIVWPARWARFFNRLRERGAPGARANALLHLMPGVLIVAFHNVWHGVPAILTVYGWLLVIKASIYLVHPPIGLRAMGMVREDNPRSFVLVGVPMVVVGLLLM
ncbi:MAG: hypothetical protein ACI8Y8_004056 [Planctomycetota bacterium]|jgi:hypothetical protein